MDQYQAVRSLPFAALASALGINLETFKRRKGKHGHELYGPCPICKPKHNTTAFSYAEDGMWNCFAGGHHGRGAIDFVKEIRSCGFHDAVTFLEVVKGLPPREKPASGQNLANSEHLAGELKPLEKDTWRKFAVACPWLEARVPSADIRERYGVFCYDNPSRPKSAYRGRVMLPVKDVEGKLYGYLGRLVPSSTPQDVQRPEAPKYLFPKNLPKSRFLFGAYELWEARPHRIVYLVESPFCVLKFASLGLAAVSPFGWSLSEDQLSLLCNISRGILYLPDANKRREAGSVLPNIASRLWVRFPPLPDGCEDPESLTAEQIMALTK